LEAQPELGSEKFQCPHCKVISQQVWFSKNLLSSITNNIIRQNYYDYRYGIKEYNQKAIESFIAQLDLKFGKKFSNFFPSDLAIATCFACEDITVWIEKEMVYPKMMSVPPPNDDLDDDIKSLYYESASILNDSPKGSTALLRLALQKILKQIGKGKKKINDDIKDLVAEGLSTEMQQALDIVRVLGNNAVHPGQIDLEDNSEIALRLFEIINFIADQMITKPKELKKLYTDIIPDNTKDHINQRDGK